MLSVFRASDVEEYAAEHKLAMQGEIDAFMEDMQSKHDHEQKEGVDDSRLIEKFSG